MTTTIKQPEITKDSIKPHLKNDTQIIEDHSKSIGSKTIQKYPSTTGI